MENLQSDVVASKVLGMARKFDITAKSKPWNGKKQRLLAALHYGSPTIPPKEIRAEITSSKNKIYWWIGYESPVYKQYGEKIEKIADKIWGEKYKGEETRIIFESFEEFELFVNDCIGIVDDINVAIPPKKISEGGKVIVCPRCEEEFRKAPRCPECGQLVKL